MSGLFGCNKGGEQAVMELAQFRSFVPALIQWQQQHGRHHLPWQQTDDPYHVWLSEIMLQQTQVTTVLDYYQRFLERFPSIECLAQAPVEDVLGLWSGLGYYSRARNLHRCAQTIAQKYQGQFPDAYEALLELPGIGPSTAAAISAFCFGQRVSILDGNVKRVITRVLGYKKDISSSRVQRELWQIAQQLLPSESYVKTHPQAMRHYTQGLMDLGSGVCLPRKAQCTVCPMKKMCIAAREGEPTAYPVKTKKLKRSTRAGYLLWLVSPLGVWLSLRPESGIWGGLYSMPVFDEQENRTQVISTLKTKNVEDLPTFKHVLTHLDWLLQPTIVELSAAQAKKLHVQNRDIQGQWFLPQEWRKLGLPAPIRKLLQSYE